MFNKYGYAWIIVTGFWAFVGIVAPFFVLRGHHRGLIRLSLVLTAATCWLFWMCAFVSQLNPLLGPKLDNTTVLFLYQYTNAKKK